ncbi:very long chain fatty acid elongase 4-like [Apostichopus japonicus]|uniref:very long chain fatty acid elongase 4-like n=1 Tax=Stichopus japonicus TaxID=307972 RepID=UPI003AB1BD62
MDLIQDKLNETYNYYLYTLTFSDPRVADWFLMQSPLPTIAIAIIYLLTVWLGPKIMAKREAFDLHYFMVFYNFSCVLLGAHIVKELFYCAFIQRKYNIFCQEMVYSEDEYEYRIAKALWWYYFSKGYELLDTIIFILRKKNNQVTFLHVYHHTSMFVLWWIGMKWVAGGMSVFGSMLNSSIHVIMYSYYGLSALGPQFYKYLWWKKYLTVIQLAQFFVCLVLAVQSIYFQCQFYLWMQYAFLAYGTSLVLLFANFYVHAYIKKERLPKMDAAKNVGKQQNGVSARKSKNRAVGNGHQAKRARNGQTVTNGKLNGKKHK